MKYKVGDKVRIKSSNKLRNIPCDVTEKLGYAGLTATILTADTGVDCKDEGYKINLDKKEWWWFDSDFDDSYTPEKSILSEEMIGYIAEVIKKHNLGVCVSENDGKLIIEPLGEKEEDLPIDTPVMCSCSMKGELAWFVRFYAGSRKTWWDLGKSYNEKRKVDWKCIIPFDRFNPNDIEESLKYNIIK